MRAAAMNYATTSIHSHLAIKLRLFWNKFTSQKILLMPTSRWRHPPPIVSIFFLSQLQPFHSFASSASPSYKLAAGDDGEGRWKMEMMKSREKGTPQQQQSWGCCCAVPEKLFSRLSPTIFLAPWDQRKINVENRVIALLWILMNAALLRAGFWSDVRRNGMNLNYVAIMKRRHNSHKA